MPSLAELRKKIKGISSTRQITKAMKMVAGARFSRAARQMTDAIHYQAELEKVLFAFLSLAGPPRARFASLYRAPGSPPPQGKSAIIVVSADKGLCGDFNNGIIREADAYIKKNGENVVSLFAIGRKSVEHYKDAKIEKKTEHAQFFNRFDFTMADKIGQEALKIYQEDSLVELMVVHSHFKSRLKQSLTITRLLPVEYVPPKETVFGGMMIEPLEEEEVLQTLLPMYIKAKLYAILRDSFAAELAARMSAMDNATRNAGSLIDTITLEMNKVRQAVITREIAEIISTNEVVK